MERKIRYRGKNQNCSGRPKKVYEPLTPELTASVKEFYLKQKPMLLNYCWCYSQMVKNVTQDDVLGYFEEIIVTHVAGTREPIDKFGYEAFTKTIARSVLNNLINRRWYTSTDMESENEGYDEDGEYFSIFDTKVKEINFIEHVMENEHNQFIIDKMMSSLNEQEKNFIKYYFTDECMQNSAEVGRKFGCTRQNADYIIKRALHNLSVEFKKIMF